MEVSIMEHLLTGAMVALTEQISEVAVSVYQELGAGHLEPPYQKAMEVGLRLKGIKFEAEKVVPIIYRGHYVGECYVDLLVADSVAVELKAVGAITAADQAQLRRYMALLGAPSGMLINFPQVPKTKAGGVPADTPDIIILPTQGAVE